MKRFVVGVGTLALLAGCAGVTSGQEKPYAPSSDARDAFATEVETGFGSQFMSSISDHDSFRSGIEDAGDMACKYALNSKTRDEYQTMFRQEMSKTQNGSSLPNSVIDGESLVIWSAALKNLCPSVTKD